MIDRIHFGFFLYRTVDEWYIIPETDSVKSIIVVDCKRQTIRSQSVSVKIPQHAEVSTFQIFLGAIKLMANYYLIISNDCQPSIELANHRVFEVSKIQFLRVNLDNLKKDDINRLLDERFIQMFRDSCSKQRFFCSRTYDLSRPAHENYNKAHDARSIYSVDKEFVWNWYLMEDILSNCKGLEQYLMPLINGFCAEYKRDIQYVLISRRNRLRAGMRYYRRGIDCEGNAANYVQTEQILCTDNRLYSFLQIRGSIPLYWTQRPNLMYKPLPCITSKDHVTAFDLHFDRLSQRHGRVTIVSLIDHRGVESGLSAHFQKLATRSHQIVYREFDFHHQSSKSDRFFHLLLDMVNESIEHDGYCVVDLENEKVVTNQKGIIRTNCIDSLDRTNVVQSRIAKTVLETQLAIIFAKAVSQFKHHDTKSSAKIVRLDGTLDLFEFDVYLYQNFLNIWADNADALSLQYSGTPAMKTDYTRTGVRTVRGRLNDAYHSVLRYVLNNFGDGYRQDAIDLFVGNYKLGSEQLETTLRRTARKPDYRLLFMPLLSVFSFFMLLLSFSNDVAPSKHRTINILFWMSSIGFSLCCTLLFGESIVDVPNLSPIE